MTSTSARGRPIGQLAVAVATGFAWWSWLGWDNMTGLWVVGAGLLFVGLAVGSTIVTTAAWAARGR